MNSHKNGLLVILVSSVLLVTFLVPISASSNDDQIMPYYINTDRCFADFEIINDVATVVVYYYGDASEFTKAEISVKIQKRFLLVT